VPGSSHAEFFSDAKKIPLDKLTNQGFLGFCPKIFFFFFGTRLFSCSKKNVLVARKKILQNEKKNCFVTLSRGIFLASEKKIL